MNELRQEFEALRARFPPGFESSLVLPCLRRIQLERGWVSDSDIAGLAGYLNVPQVQIEEVLSFYTQFRRHPIGRWHLQVCQNVSCSMRGADSILSRLTRILGIAPGQTTPDGRFTLNTVECLGSCGTAPAMMINERYVEDITPDALGPLLEELK